MLGPQNEIKPIQESDLSFGDLGDRLDQLQRKMTATGGKMLILVDGFESSGKGYLISRMRRELDPRYYHVRLFEDTEPGAYVEPPQKRFWKELPKRGQIAIFDHSYYTALFNDLDGDEKEHKKDIEFLLSQEKMLRLDDLLIIKLFLDISEKTQKEKIEDLEKDKYREFLVSSRDREQNKHYEKYRKHMGKILSLSSSTDAPWHILSMEHRKGGTKKAMKIVIDTLTEAISHWKTSDHLPTERMDYVDLMGEKIDFSSFDRNILLESDKYDEEIEELQKEAEDLAYELYTKNKSLVIAFEGTDAAGKGGAIKRLTKFMDPRGYRIHSIAAPTEDELAHHYMHRFVTKLPNKGNIAIFDRSWYGRVLVERIEGFASKDEWSRAYDEINRMEDGWEEAGVHLIKFYIAIDKDEQKERFNARENEPEKQYKLTDEDWRNRKKWDEYEEAAQDMFDKTSTKSHPWNVIAGGDKRHARVEVLKKVIKKMKEIL